MRRQRCKCLRQEDGHQPATETTKVQIIHDDQSYIGRQGVHEMRVNTYEYDLGGCCRMIVTSWPIISRVHVCTSVHISEFSTLCNVRVHSKK